MPGDEYKNSEVDESLVPQLSTPREIQQQVNLMMIQYAKDHYPQSYNELDFFFTPEPRKNEQLLRQLESVAGLRDHAIRGEILAYKCEFKQAKSDLLDEFVNLLEDCDPLVIRGGESKNDKRAKQIVEQKNHNTPSKSSPKLAPSSPQVTPPRKKSVDKLSELKKFLEVLKPWLFSNIRIPKRSAFPRFIAELSKLNNDTKSEVKDDFANLKRALSVEDFGVAVDEYRKLGDAQKKKMRDHFTGNDDNAVLFSAIQQFAELKADKKAEMMAYFSALKDVVYEDYICDRVAHYLAYREFEKKLPHEKEFESTDPFEVAVEKAVNELWHEQFAEGKPKESFEFPQFREAIIEIYNQQAGAHDKSIDAKSRAKFEARWNENFILRKKCDSPSHKQFKPKIGQMWIDELSPVFELVEKAKSVESLTGELTKQKENQDGAIDETKQILGDHLTALNKKERASAVLVDAKLSTYEGEFRMPGVSPQQFAASSRAVQRWPTSRSILPTPAKKKLFSIIPEVNAVDQYGNTALFYVVQEIFNEKCKGKRRELAYNKLFLLIKNGARVDFVNKNKDKPRTIFDLGDCSEWINKKDENGNTILHWFAYHGLMKSFYYALTHGAKDSITNDYKQTPWDVTNNGKTLYEQTLSKVELEQDSDIHLEAKKPKTPPAKRESSDNNESTESKGVSLRKLPAKYSYVDFVECVFDRVENSDSDYVVAPLSLTGGTKLSYDDVDEKLEEKAKEKPKFLRGQNLIREDQDFKTSVEKARHLKQQEQFALARLKMYTAKTEEFFAGICLFLRTEIDSNQGVKQSKWVQHLLEVNKVKVELILLATQQLTPDELNKKTEEILAPVKQKFNKVQKINLGIDDASLANFINNNAQLFPPQEFVNGDNLFHGMVKRGEPVEKIKEQRNMFAKHPQIVIDAVKGRNNSGETPVTAGVIAAYDAKKKAEFFIKELNILYSQSFALVLSHLYRAQAKYRFDTEDYQIIKAKIKAVELAVTNIAQGNPLLTVLDGLLADPAIQRKRDSWNPKHWVLDKKSDTEEILMTVKTAEEKSVRRSSQSPGRPSDSKQESGKLPEPVQEQPSQMGLTPTG